MSMMVMIIPIQMDFELIIYHKVIFRFWSNHRATPDFHILIHVNCKFCHKLYLYKKCSSYSVSFLYVTYSMLFYLLELQSGVAPDNKSTLPSLKKIIYKRNRLPSKLNSSLPSKSDNAFYRNGFSPTYSNWSN